MVFIQNLSHAKEMRMELNKLAELMVEETIKALYRHDDMPPMVMTMSYPCRTTKKGVRFAVCACHLRYGAKVNQSVAATVEITKGTFGKVRLDPNPKGGADKFAAGFKVVDGDTLCLALERQSGKPWEQSAFQHTRRIA